MTATSGESTTNRSQVENYGNSRSSNSSLKYSDFFEDYGGQFPQNATRHIGLDRLNHLMRISEVTLNEFDR